jgi:hypothetical protein
LEQSVGLLRLEGPDTLRFLHGQTSQDLVQAPPGAWRRTRCISPTARLRALAEVLVDGGGAWLLITAGDAAAVRTALDRVLFPADAVQIGPLQEGLWLEPVGPDLPIPAAAFATWEPLEGAQGWRLGPVAVVPAGVSVPADLAALAPLPEPERQRRRIALGLPAAGAEINEETNPFELGLADHQPRARREVGGRDIEVDAEVVACECPVGLVADRPQRADVHDRELGVRVRHLALRTGLGRPAVTDEASREIEHPGLEHLAFVRARARDDQVDLAGIARRGADIVESCGELLVGAGAVDGHQVQVFHGRMR